MYDTYNPKTRNIMATECSNYYESVDVIFVLDIETLQRHGVCLYSPHGISFLFVQTLPASCCYYEQSLKAIYFGDNY